jgi:L-threonylcarbamoyladenylate synthase
LTSIRKIDAIHPGRETLLECAQTLRNGGVAAVPTISFYGLLADAHNEAAFDQVLEIKRRPSGKPLPLLIPNQEWACKLCAAINDHAAALMKAFWPGGLTLVVPAAAAAPPYAVSQKGTIGLRVPSHPVAAGALALFDGPVTGTSANEAGAPPCRDAGCVQTTLTLQPDLILDGGTTSGAAGSTVVDVSGAEPAILREGLIPARDIFAAL